MYKSAIKQQTNSVTSVYCAHKHSKQCYWTLGSMSECCWLAKPMWCETLGVPSFSDTCINSIGVFWTGIAAGAPGGGKPGARLTKGTVYSHLSTTRMIFALTKVRISSDDIRTYITENKSDGWLIRKSHTHFKIIKVSMLSMAIIGL